VQATPKNISFQFPLDAAKTKVDYDLFKKMDNQDRVEFMTRLFKHEQLHLKIGEYIGAKAQTYLQNQIEAGSKKYQISITKTGLTAEDAIKNAMDAAKAWGRSILTPNMTTFEKNVKTIVINAKRLFLKHPDQ
jgi:hypothetical protein